MHHQKIVNYCFLTWTQPIWFVTHLLACAWTKDQCPDMRDWTLLAGVLLDNIHFSILSFFLEGWGQGEVLGPLRWPRGARLFFFFWQEALSKCRNKEFESEAEISNSFWTRVLSWGYLTILKYPQGRGKNAPSVAPPWQTPTSKIPVILFFKYEVFWKCEH